MTFEEILDQAMAMLQRRGRLTYRTLQRQFQLDDAALDDLKEQLFYAHPQVVDDAGRGLVWAGNSDATPTPTLSPPSALPHTPMVQGARPSADAAAPEAERRQLTVMFCDLVGSTALSAQLDPEELREVVRAYQTTCAEVIQQFEGHIAQYLGDGLLVYFGYPQAHEDDAQRAVFTGLGMVEAMDTLNSRLEQGQGVRLAVRVGIHTGLAVVSKLGDGGRHERLALGETPNVAARLQGLAAPDTVVISATTHQLVQGLFACQVLGTPALKGLDEPLAVYHVRGASSAQSRFEVAVSTGLTPLVGREEEVRLLRRRWAQATAGAGQVVLLSGEAGIGKSRLVQELRECLAQEAVTPLVLHCSPYHQHSALYPVLDHLQRVLQLRRDEAPAVQLAKLERELETLRLPLPEVMPLFAALLSLPHPAPYPPLSVSPQQQRQQTFAALVAWLRAAAERQPVLAVWENLHWADPSTLELLGLCIDQAPTARLLLLRPHRRRQG